MRIVLEGIFVRASAFATIALLSTLLVDCSGGGGSPTAAAPAQQLAQAADTVRLAASNTAPTVTAIYKFKGGADGVGPESTLLYTNGKFYGTTSGIKGGRNVACGTAFSITPNANFTSFKETVLHTFSGGSDGCWPSGGLILVGSNLYGVTIYGGSSNVGTVYSIPIAGGSESVLYSFTGGLDGAGPQGPLLNVGSNFYLPTVAGGANGGHGIGGTVVSIPVSGGPATTLYSFAGSPDASIPNGGLIDVGNTLYGTSGEGGSNNIGAIFSVPIAGGPDTILTSIGGPNGGLITIGSSLYGTNSDLVFSEPIGGGPAATVYNLDDQDVEAPVTLIGNRLYGTTVAGGLHGRDFGTVYSLNVSGSGYKTLYNFPRGNGVGSSPFGGVIEVNGSLYGTCLTGGVDNNGTVFKLSNF